MTKKKLTRSINNRKIAGVCGGLGEYLNVDPLVFRIIFLFLLLCGGGGFFIYLIFWILTPECNHFENKTETQYTTYQEVVAEEKENNSQKKNDMKKSTGLFWGLLLVAFGLLWLGRSFGLFHFHWHNLLRLWPLLIICLGISLLPIERVWKNVCNFIILAIAIVLLFILPASKCHHHFWEDDCKYEIRKIFRGTEIKTSATIEKNGESDLQAGSFFE